MTHDFNAKNKRSHLHKTSRSVFSSAAARQELFHLIDLELNLVVRKDFAILAPRLVNLAQIGGKFEAVDSAAVISHNDDGVIVVEANVRQLGPLDHLLLAQRLVLVFGQIKYVHLGGGRVKKVRGGRRGNKSSGTIGRGLTLPSLVTAAKTVDE